MGTIDRLKCNMTERPVLKACPICGSAPVLKTDSLDYGNGHGYPGCFLYRFECSGCGMITTDEKTDIYDKAGAPTAEQRAAREWNETVDYVADLIKKTNGGKL